MIALHGNRLLPLIALALLALAVFVMTRGGKTNGPRETSTWSTVVSSAVNPASPLADVPKAPQPDADSPAEAVRTLSAQVTQMADTVQAWTRESEQLRKLRDTLRHEVGNDITEELKRTQHKVQEQGRAEDHKALQAIGERIDALAGQVSLLDVQHRLSSDESGAAVPPGLGLETTPPTSLPTKVNRQLVWIEPLGSVAEGATSALQKAVLKPAPDRPPQESMDPVPQAAASLSSDAPGHAEGPRRVYTVPENASLMNATAFSALIGRVPVKGVVSDPFPFKVLIGADNLAANGIEIPGLYGAVFRGVATGDLNLRCVRGDLVSVTFVFDDGTIRTVRAEGKDRLGSLSDRQGIGCVSGRLITNAPAYLAQRTLVMGLETGAKAAAASETTSVVTATGATANSVTGSTGKFIAGEMVSGGASEIRRWLDERQGQSFDAIFVEPGAEVVLDVEREIAIDYDPQGRRTTYATAPTSPRHGGLD